MQPDVVMLLTEVREFDVLHVERKPAGPSAHFEHPPITRDFVENEGKYHVAIIGIVFPYSLQATSKIRF